MEIKQYKVEKGIAHPKTAYSDLSKDELLKLPPQVFRNCISDEEIKFIDDHTYATNAQDGVYDADCFSIPVWQYESQRDNKWYDVPEEWIKTHNPVEKYLSSWYDKTRQFLPFNPIPKMETTELPSPESYDNLKRQLNTQAKHKDSIRDYWLSCSESKKKWVEAIEEYFSGEHTEIKTFEEFKYQFDLD